MPNLMLTEMGLNVASGVGKYLVGTQQYKLDKAVQKHKELMAALSAAQSNNAVTRQEDALRDSNVLADIDIQVQGLQDQADFDVEAAAAGIMGNSVNVGRRALNANAARAQTSRLRKFTYEALNLADTRKQIDLNMIYNRDTSVVQKPSIGAALLGITQDLVDTWDAHNPADRRTSGLLSKGA